MKRIKRVVMLTLMMAAVAGCKKDGDPKPEKREPTYRAEDYTTIDMRIIVPEGVAIDLTDAKVYSWNTPLEVGPDGTAKVVNIPGYHNVAYVFDGADNLVLAGFVTDTSAVISAATTAEVLVYYGLGIPLLPAQVSDFYINGADRLPFMKDFKAGLEQLFRTDAQLLTTGSFASLLGETIAAFQATAEAQLAQQTVRNMDRVMATERAADLFIDADIKSGLQIAQSGLGSFTITNSYRRRAHAFLYKTGYKDLTGKSTTLISLIDGDVKAAKDVAISSTAGITGFLGVMMAYIADKDSEFSSTTTEAIQVPLLENESEATYRIKIIGPGNEGNSGSITQDETSASVRLALETMMFDFALPLISDIIGFKDFVKKKDLFADDAGGGVWEEALNKTATFIAMLPAVKAEMDNGRYDLAVKELFWALANKIAEDQGNDMMQAVTKALINVAVEAAMPGADKLDDALMNSQLTRKIKIMQALDFIMKAVDYGRLIHDISSSKMVENWEFTAVPVDVNLDPKAPTVGVSEQVKLTAFLKTTVADGEVVAYEWKTTGKYGHLWDDRGHKGNTFTSSLEAVYYLSNDTEDGLGDGDNIDEVTVRAYIKRGQDTVEVGRSTAKVNVQKQNWFFVAYTLHDGISEPMIWQGRTVYNYGPPGVTAQFATVPGARGYEIRSVWKDGTKGNWVIASSIKVSDGVATYRVIIGPIRLGDSVSPEVAEQERKRNLQTLADYPVIGIDVRPVM